jgi:hypothetical protein
MNKSSLLKYLIPFPAFPLRGKPFSPLGELRKGVSLEFKILDYKHIIDQPLILN